MATKETLVSLVLVGLSTLGGAGCSNNPEYRFNGKIEEEEVRFYEKTLWGINNLLEVVKADGSKLKYFDSNDDFRIESVEITAGDNTTIYAVGSRNPVVAGIVEKAQKEFDKDN